MHLIYPPRCTICNELVEDDFALCGPCWRDTPLIAGLCCDACGTPLPGEDTGDPEYCDDCLTIARPWSRGRSVMLYKDNGRRLVLALKHGDRHEILRPAAVWLETAAKAILPEGPVLIAPVPLHWSRLLKRTYNQSGLLAQALGKRLNQTVVPDLLIRTKRTRTLDGLGRDERFAELEQSISLNPARTGHLQGQTLLILDDVMTSGATLSASTQAALREGVVNVMILTLARVAKDA